LLQVRRAAEHLLLLLLVLLLLQDRPRRLRRSLPEELPNGGLNPSGPACTLLLLALRRMLGLRQVGARLVAVVGPRPWPKARQRQAHAAARGHAPPRVERPRRGRRQQGLLLRQRQRAPCCLGGRRLGAHEGL
jgi:hypothetical protein